MEHTQTIKPNVILEPISRTGKKRLEVDGNEFILVRKINQDNTPWLLKIRSFKNNSAMLINIHGDKDYNVKFQ
jgi:hypothetical protein